MRHNLWKTKCPYLNIRQSHYGSCIRVIGDFGNTVVLRNEKAQQVFYPCRGKQPRITNYLIMLISDFLLKIGSVGNPVCTRIDLIKNFLDIDTRIFEFNLPSSIIAFSMTKKIPRGVWKRKRKIEPFFTGFHWFSQSRLVGPSVELRLKWIFLYLHKVKRTLCPRLYLSTKLVPAYKSFVYCLQMNVTVWQNFNIFLRVTVFNCSKGLSTKGQLPRPDCLKAD